MAITMHGGGYIRVGCVWCVLVSCAVIVNATIKSLCIHIHDRSTYLDVYRAYTRVSTALDIYYYG